MGRMNLFSIRELGQLILDKKTSSLELAQDLLADIHARDKTISAFTSVNPELLLAEATKADSEIASGNYRGPLHGIPIGLKDIVNVAGYSTQCGSPLYPSTPATSDSDVATSLKNSGAVVAGKTTSHELACGVTSPPTSNPWNLDYVPGGSSGGSGAAVASGYVRAAIGSDTGGSIRIPASLCGIVGLKPTYGLISANGIEPLSTSLDHIGPLTASVEDCAIVLNALVRSNPRNASRNLPNDYSTELNLGIKGMRIGVLAGPPFAPMQPDVEHSFNEAISQLEKLGATCLSLDIPELEHTLAVEFGIIPLEASEYHLQSLRAHPEMISASIRSLLVAGRVIPRSVYLRACQGRKIISSSFRHVFETNRLDAVITPTLPATAARKGQVDFQFGGVAEEISMSYVRTTAPFNVSGMPALSIPCGFDELDLPIGLQIATAPYCEHTALRIANAYAIGTGWKLNPPPSI